VEPIIATRDRNTGILPARLADILSASPPDRSGVQLRWAHRLKVCVPVIRVIRIIRGQDSSFDYRARLESCEKVSIRPSSRAQARDLTYLYWLHNLVRTPQQYL